MSEVGQTVRCTVCGRVKQPIGRDARCGGYCHGMECEGYLLEPSPSDLWPGETREEFGYPKAEKDHG